MSIPLSGQIVQATLCDENAGNSVDRTWGSASNPPNQVTLLSTLLPNNTTLTGEHIRLYGIVKADIFITFSNCDLEMGPGAQFVSETNFGALAVGTDFYSCTQMWKGLLAKRFAGLYIFDCRIEDAEYGITSDDGTYLYVAETDFNKNHIGIRNGEGAAGQSSLVPLYFSGNTFDCSAGLRGAYPGQNSTPAATSWAYCGIYLNKVVASFLSNNLTTFQNLRLGIEAVDADFAVSHCNFTNMKKFWGIPGFGIRCNGGSLTINTSNSGNDPSSFMTGVFYGIEAVGSDLDISGADFLVDYSMGIYSHDNGNADMIVIQNNQFTISPNLTIQRGAYVERTSRSGDQISVDISFNTLTMNGSTSTTADQTGILLNTNNPGTDIAMANWNTGSINLAENHPQHFVQMDANNTTNADRFWMFGNSAVYNGSGNYKSWGVSMLDVGGLANEIRWNNITGNIPTIPISGRSSGYCGIHVQNVANLNLCDNIVDDQEHGLHLFGAFGNLGLHGNTMIDHLWALRVQDNSSTSPATQGSVGNHLRTGNRWTGGIPPVGWGVFYDSTLPAGNNPGQGGTLTVPTGSNANNPAVPQDWSSNNFLRQLDRAETLCPPAPPEIGGKPTTKMKKVAQMPPASILSDYDIQVASANIGQSGSILWEQQLVLLCKLLRFPELLGQNAAVDAFYLANENTQLRQFAGISHNHYMALESTSDLEGDLNYHHEAQKSLISSLTSFQTENQQVLSALNLPGETILNEFNALAETWKTSRNEHSTIKKAQKLERQVWLEQAMELNQEIEPEDQLQRNLQFLNYFRLKKAMGSEISEQDWDDLREIAHQCSEDAGSTVVTAIRLLPVEESVSLLPSETDEHAPNCGSEERADEHFHSHRNALELFPNPASNSFAASFPENETWSWDVFDLNGVGKLSGEAIGNSTTAINAEHLLPGVYVFYCWNNRGAVFHQKLVISK